MKEQITKEYGKKRIYNGRTTLQARFEAGLSHDSAAYIRVPSNAVSITQRYPHHVCCSFCNRVLCGGCWFSWRSQPTCYLRRTTVCCYRYLEHYQGCADASASQLVDLLTACLSCAVTTPTHDLGGMSVEHWHISWHLPPPSVDVIDVGCRITDFYGDQFASVSHHIYNMSWTPCTSGDSRLT